MDGVLFQMSRASTSTTCKRPCLTTAKIPRKEYGIPSVSTVMAGKAVRASLKYRSSKGWVQQLYATDPSTAAAPASWRAKVEKSCSVLLKKFGVTSVTSTMSDWVESGAFQGSWAQKSLGGWGRFSRKTFLAAAARDRWTLVPLRRRMLLAKLGSGSRYCSMNGFFAVSQRRRRDTPRSMSTPIDTAL